MHTRRSQHAIALTLLLIAALPGCSWMAVQRPVRPLEPTAKVECTESRAAPIADTVGAVWMGLGGVIVTGIGATWSSCPSNDSFLCLHGDDRAAILGAGVALLAAGTAYAFSAASGYGATRTCRDVHAAQGGCREGDAAACAAVDRLFAPPPATRSEAPVTGPSCTSDRECFGGRTCRGGTCGF